MATLDSPPLNLFDRAMFEALQATIAEVEADLPRALLIRAEGRAVSGGVDVAEFDGLTPEQGEPALGRADRHGRTGRSAAAAGRLRRPRADPYRGLRAGARLRPDPRRRSAKFGLVEKVVGLTPSMGGTQRLAERAGSGRAREFVMTGELFGAEQLEGWGVVNRVFEDDGFDEQGARLRRRVGGWADQGARDDQARPAPLP